VTHLWDPAAVRRPSRQSLLDVLSGLDLEGLHVGGPDRSEVTLVERRDLRFTQALGESDDARIDDAEREICIARLQLAAAGRPSRRTRPAARPAGHPSRNRRRTE
jgi:hypothetical protein